MEITPTWDETELFHAAITVLIAVDVITEEERIQYQEIVDKYLRLYYQGNLNFS